MSTAFPRLQRVASLRHRLIRDFQRYQFSRRARNLKNPLSDDEVDVLTSYEFLLCHAHEKEGMEAVREAIGGIAGVLGASEEIVVRHYRYLVEELEAKKHRRADSEPVVRKKKNGVTRVLLSLGDIVRREVDSRVERFAKMMECEPNSALENSSINLQESITIIPATCELPANDGNSDEQSVVLPQSAEQGTEEAAKDKPSALPPTELPVYPSLQQESPTRSQTPAPDALPESEIRPEVCSQPWSDLSVNTLYSAEDFQSKYKLTSELIETAWGTPTAVFVANETDGESIPKDWVFLLENEIRAEQSAPRDEYGHCDCLMPSNCYSDDCPCVRRNKQAYCLTADRFPCAG